MAAEAGTRMLRAGGHAVDAAIAAGAVLSVVEPSASGIGGDAFLLIWDRSDGAVSALNGSGAAPEGLSADRFAGMAAVPARGAASLTVPGCVAAWYEAWYGWGRISWRELFEPAIALAEVGFAVSWRLARVLRRERAVLEADPGLASLFIRGGRPLEAGEICRPEALARTLKAIARDGAEALSTGTLAERLCRGIRAAGGVLRVADLEKHESELRGALEMPVRRAGGEPDLATRRAIDAISPDLLTLCEQPLPSQGLLVPLALRILEETDAAPAGGPASAEGTISTGGAPPGGNATAGTPAWGAALRRSEMHRQVESIRVAFAVRDLFLADPHALPVPEAELLGALFDTPTVMALARLVGKKARAPRMEYLTTALSPRVPPLVPPTRPFAEEVIEAIAAAGPGARAVVEAYRGAGFGIAAPGADGTDTTYLCAADHEGNAVGLIQSIFSPFGCGFLEPSSGIILNNRASGFSLDQRSPNRLGPGKRARHTLNSWMLLGPDGPCFVGGTPGAQNQVVVNLQVIRALLAGRPLWGGPAPMRPETWTEARLDARTPISPDELLASILEAPRWDLDPLGRVRVEARAPGECRRLLRRAGHEAVRGGPWEGAGYVQAIQIAADGGLLGATDPRGEGIALGI
jgi:gamma-glutamyltranspeptidase/glutathione hydrolase